jgi:mRNA interferase RelE/StbE
LVWKIEYAETAVKSLKKLNKSDAKKIINYLDERVITRNDPRTLGKALKGNLGEFWRYRIGDYRVLCEIKDEQLVILAAEIGHRKNIYN